MVFFFKYLDVLGEKIVLIHNLAILVMSF